MYTVIIFSLAALFIIPSIRSKLTIFSKPTFALLTILFLSTATAEAAYTKIAKHAGINHQKFEDIVEKIVKVESTTGSYHIENKKSGAYGRYQIMPKTARDYTQRLGIPHSKWKQPHNQDRIFQAILKDNIQALKRNGIKISAFTIYGAHQQGAGGFNAIMKNKKLTKQMERNLRYNLPKELRKIDRSRLVTVWKKYWQEKFS